MKKHNIQQRTPEWHQLRKGKITGTGLKSIMGTSYARDEYFYESLAQRLTVGLQDVDYENAMDRGTRLEPDAIAMFELETGKSVEKVGFCEDDDDPTMANSPDALIGNTEAVEVKCLGGKNHVRMWLENEIPKDYFWQVVQYFVINPKLKKLYFVGYNPDIPVHSLHIIEVSREDVADSIVSAKKTQEEFIQKVNSKLKEIIEL